MEARPLYALEDRALLAEIVRALVTSPAHVRVEEEQRGEKLLVLHLYVRPQDRGLIIGQKGRTIRILSNLFSLIGFRDGREIKIEVVHDED